MSALRQIPDGRHPGRHGVNENLTPVPMPHQMFLYGMMDAVMYSSPVYTTNMVLFFTVIIAFSVIMKRRSARPGGRIYQYNQSKVHKLVSDRRRRLRDMLNDPALVQDMERQYGDLSSMRDSVKQWESDGFALQKKDDYVDVRGNVAVPWITIANLWLLLITCIVSYFSFNALTMMILLMSLVHIADNMLLLRAARGGKGRDNKSENKGTIAALGVPVLEVEVGVPVKGIVTV